MNDYRSAALREIRRRQAEEEIKRREAERKSGGLTGALKSVANAPLKAGGKAVDLGSEAVGQTFKGIERFTGAVDRTPVPFIPAIKKIVEGDVKGALWFDAHEDDSIGFTGRTERGKPGNAGGVPKLGDPKRIAGETIRKEVPGIPGRVLAGAAEVVLDPTNLMGVGLVSKAGKANRLTRVATELLGRGDMSKANYLKMLAGAGAGSAIGGEIGGTPGAILGGLGGGMGSLANISRLRKAKSAANIEASLSSETARNLDGMNEQAAEGIRRSESRFKSYKTADRGVVKEITDEGLQDEVTAKRAQAFTLAQRPGMKFQADVAAETADALQAGLNYMRVAGKTTMFVPDEIDFGRAVKAENDLQAQDERRLLDALQGEAVTADLDAAANKLPDFRFEEEGRGLLSDIFRQQLKNTPGSIEGQVAQVRDFDTQVVANKAARTSQEEAVKLAREAQKARYNEVLAGFPPGAKSSARRVLDAMIGGKDVEGPFGNLVARFPAARDMRPELEQVFGEVAGMNQLTRQADTTLQELIASGKGVEETAKQARRSIGDQMNAEFGRAFNTIKDRIIQIPGQAGRYRPVRMVLENGKPAVVLDYIKPAKKVEDILSDSGVMRAEEDVAYRAKIEEVRELKSQQAALRRSGDEAGSSALVAQIRDAEDAAKKLKEPARPISAKDLPKAERRLIVPLDDAREFVVFKPGKTGTPTTLARAGYKDVRTVKLLNDESVLRVQAKEISNNLTALNLEKMNLESKIELTPEEKALLDNGFKDEVDADKVTAINRLKAVEQSISRFETEALANDADMAAIQNSVLSSQQVLEASLATARDEAVQLRQLYEDSLVEHAEAQAKIAKMLDVTPEEAASQYLNKQNEINEFRINEVFENFGGKRMSQAAYEQEIENLNQMAVRESAYLPKPAQEALGNLRNGFMRSLHNMGDKNVISRVLAPQNNLYRLVDPEARRQGLLGYGRRVVGGTGMRSETSEGILAGFFNAQQTGAQIADLDFGNAKRGAAKINDNWLTKMADETLPLKEQPIGKGKQRMYMGSSVDVTEVKQDMFMTPSRADAETYGAADARLTGGKSRVYEFEVDPTGVRVPEDASGLATSRGAVRVSDPSKVRLLQDKANKAAWARSVQAEKDPVIRMQSVLRNAVKPIDSYQWKQELAGVPEGPMRQEIYDTLADKYEVLTRNPNLFKYDELDPSFVKYAKEYGSKAAEVRERSGMKGIARNLLKMEYREFTPTGRVQNPDGTITVLKAAERNLATDLYEIMLNASADPKRSKMREFIGKPSPMPDLKDMLIDGKDWEVTLAANQLNKIASDGTWTQVAKQLKDPKAVETLKRGQSLNGNEWKDKTLAEDWPKIRGHLIPEMAGGWTKNLDAIARGVQKLAASTIVGDGSFATVQGLIHAAVAPASTAKMMRQYWNHALTDEGFAIWMSDGKNYNNVVDLANRGLGLGRSSLSGFDNPGNMFQSIPGLKRVGNAMAGLDKIAFDRMQLMNKVNLVETLEADLQLMRLVGPEVGKEFIDGIPTLSQLNKSVDIYQSTPDQIRTGIVRQVNNTLGGLSKSQTLLGRDRQALESTLLFVPGFFRARGGLINSVGKMFKNPNSPEGYLAASILAREMLFRLSFAASVAAASGTLNVLQGETDPYRDLKAFKKETDSWATLDPRRSGGMLSGPLGDGGYIGLSWGNQAPKLYAQFLLGQKAGEFNLDPRDRLEALTGFFEGRQNPVLATIVDQIKGEDFLGRPVQTPLDRLTNAMQAFTPMFIANTAGEVNESIQQDNFNPLALTAMTGAEFFGLNVRPNVPYDVLNNRFQKWQATKDPQAQPLEWREAPVAFKELARAEGNIADAEENWLTDMGRRVNDQRAQRDILYTDWEEQNLGYDQQVTQMGVELQSGKLSKEEFRQNYSKLQEDRADLANTMNRVLGKMGVEKKDETIAGNAPALARLMAEFNAVKPLPKTNPDGTPKKQMTDAGIVMDNDIDWGRYKRDHEAVLAKFDPATRAEFEATRVPDDPNVAELQDARVTLDTYFDKLPKYRGLSNVEGKTLDGYKSILFAQEQQLRDQGLNIPRERLYQMIVRQMEQQGQINNLRQAQIASLAVKAALDPDLALKMRNMGTIAFLLENPLVFEWYPWLESELPSRFRRFSSAPQRDTSGILERELRGAQLSSVR